MTCPECTTTSVDDDLAVLERMDRGSVDRFTPAELAALIHVGAHFATGTLDDVQRARFQVVAGRGVVA